MKKITYLIMIAFMAFSFYSCEDPLPPEVKAEITFPEGQELAFTISSDGDTETINFESTKTWTVSVDEAATPWCSISPEKGDAGDANTITISSVANETTEDRVATIIIQSDKVQKKITVTQGSKDPDELVVSPKEISVIAAGEEFEVKVSSNVDIGFAIDAAATWITEVTTKTLKDTVLKFKTEANPQTEKRIGKITITCDDIEEIITVTQIGINIAVSKPVKLGNLTISDRNLGAPTYGVAYNYSNHSGHPDHQYSAFKGLYYTATDLLICPDGWRLPTKEELETISNAMQYSEGRAYLADGEGNRCYFPLSGNFENPSHANGYYWSSTPAHWRYVWSLFVTASKSNMNSDYIGRDHLLSVRCVQ